MTDYRLIIFTVIMSVFSIASNSILINKEKSSDALNSSEYKFAIGSLIGSILLLIGAIFFGLKNKINIRTNNTNYLRG